MALRAKNKVGGKVTTCILNLGDFVMKETMYVMILRSYDIVINMYWLESHESIVNGNTKWLSLFDDERQIHVIIGSNQRFFPRFISSLEL